MKIKLHQDYFFYEKKNLSFPDLTTLRIRVSRSVTFPSVEMSHLSVSPQVRALLLGAMLSLSHYLKRKINVSVLA